MAIEKSVSFRASLQSNILDLTGNVGWQCARTSTLIAGIVSQLAVYTEEGVVMTPSVFICTSVSRLVQLAGVGEWIALSGVVPIETAGPKLLKAAAPLCSGNWRIYIERLPDGVSCTFGVFCGSSDPSSMTVDEVVLDEYDEQFPVIRITQSATNKVEVRTSAGDGIEFRFNNDQDLAELKVHQHVRQLAGAISASTGVGDVAFSGYIERVLSSAIKECHGTLIAVVSATSEELPQSLSDVVLLDPPFSLYERFKQHLDEGKTSVSVSRLQAGSELVSGFIASDGITIFDDAGRVRGYRAFIQSEMVENPVAGGARTRAFGSMKAVGQRDLAAAFFRSQDGRTEFIKFAVEQQK